jgi:epidermal growth factor receptor substrate 15
VPPLTPEKAGQYAALFEKSGAQGGILGGEQAKQIFERAGLPNEIRGRIWNLADTEQRGALQATEFVIAMHLLASFKSGAMRSLPNVLPAGLYEAAARRPPSRQSTGISAIPRQMSGSSAPRTSSPLSRPTYATPQQYPQASGSTGDWAITPAEKVKYDSIYATLDRTNRGFITGDEAVPFFSESKLPEEALAQIWDLADINSAGHLSRDEFAVAMYLIRQQRLKTDGRDSLPATLPANLVPPSMRNQARPAAVPTAPAFDHPAPALPKSAAEDLFGLDALSTSPPPAAPSSTDGSAFGERGPLTPSSPIHASSPPPPSSLFKPFAPSSSFGQGLTYNATGGSTNSNLSQPRSVPQPSATEDLLGDNDPEISKKLTNETTELANLSNQVGSLSKQMQEVQSQRATAQNDLTQANSQKREFEVRLSQLRSLYEQEVKDVKSLEERLTASRNETKKLQTEYAMIEGTLKDLQNQHRQTATALQADQQENAALKEKMRVVNGEVAQLKPALEKLRSDARQQKGLVAINKKQLATNESEREKLKAEAEELNKSIEEDTKALAAAAAAAQVPSPAPVVSPAPSTLSATNPFFRRQPSNSDASNTSFTATPPATQADRSFDNVFGPSFGAAASTESQQPASRQPTASDFPSPPASVSPQVSQAAEPPPPPESRQISSSFLPFPSEHDESVSSSRQVSAPNSRFGEGSSAETPTNYLGATPTGSSAAGGQPEVGREASPGLDRKVDASPAVNGPSKDTIPGAFPTDAPSDVVASPTGGSNLSEQAAPDPFVSKGVTRTGSSKEDFDAAFAGFGSAAKPQERSHTGTSHDSSNAAQANVNKEFPPIAELDHDDDDSDSASERGGFDDDFAPASPEHKRASSAAVPTATTTNGAGSFLGAGSNVEAAKAVGDNPPTPGAQASPPQYNKSVSPGEQAHSEVQQYSGLIPDRHVPSSTEHASSSSAAPVPAQPAAAKAPFDEDYDDFDDLEDAKEGDADDHFANISVHDRSGLDDFNPVFDSPPKAPQHSAHGSTMFAGSSGFGDFTQSPTQTTPPAPLPASTAVNDSHDWDAIFAGLDSPEANATTVAAEPAKPVGNGTAAGAASNERPTVGRALTETGIHDDPILKNLTGMGYSRKDALAALEKYDYNLERVSSDYTT